MKVGIVVIGRNEAERLASCLRSVANEGYPVVYVDSSSTDSSVSIASAFGVGIVALDPSIPLSAARARNAGFEQLVAQHADLDFVQFLDGDCVLQAGWIRAAAQELDRDPSLAIVIGHLTERSANASVYNRLCALEWISPPGELENYGALGGISMMRAEIFRRLGGFRPDVIAGEDSEFAIRVRLAGHRVLKIDHAMATHDANMRTFRQWWRRAVRAGHAIGQRADINGRSAAKDCIRERNSTVFWGIALPALAALVAIPSHGASLALLLLAFTALGFRVWRSGKRRGYSPEDARLYTKFILISKFANAVGLLQFLLNKLRGHYRIIEYK